MSEMSVGDVYEVHRDQAASLCTLLGPLNSSSLNYLGSAAKAKSLFLHCWLCTLPRTWHKKANSQCDVSEARIVVHNGNGMV